jgi:hypothetical protein
MWQRRSHQTPDDQRERNGLAEFHCLRLQTTENLKRLARKENGASLGQSDEASLSNCRRDLRAEGGVNTKLACRLSESTTSCQNGIVSQRTNANEGVAVLRTLMLTSRLRG